MQEKLKDAEKRYIAIEEELATPEVFSDQSRYTVAGPGYNVGQCPPPVLGYFWIKFGIGELFPRIPLGVRKPGVAPDWVPLWGNSLRAATF